MSLLAGGAAQETRHFLLQAVEHGFRFWLRVPGMRGFGRRRARSFRLGRRRLSRLADDRRDAERNRGGARSGFRHGRGVLGTGLEPSLAPRDPPPPGPLPGWQGGPSRGGWEWAPRLGP